MLNSKIPKFYSPLEGTDSIWGPNLVWINCLDWTIKGRTVSTLGDVSTSSASLSLSAWFCLLPGFASRSVAILVQSTISRFIFWSISFVGSLEIHINLLHQQTFQSEEFFFLVQLYLIAVPRSLGRMQCAKPQESELLIIHLPIHLSSQPINHKTFI